MAKAKDVTAAGVELAAAVPPDGPVVPAAAGSGEMPPHAAPTYAEGGLPVPRVVSQLTRVRAGGAAKRYKGRVDNYNGFAKSYYVLAETEESARGCILEASGVAKRMAEMKKNGVAVIEQPVVVLHELKD